MARINKTATTPTPVTHEGAPAKRISHEKQLRRSVLACLLWENTFYEEGVEIAQRIYDLAMQVDPEKVAALAIEARHAFKLRHAPLMLLVALTKTAAGRPDGLIRKTIVDVISRADELTEFLAIYHKMGAKTESGQVKKGLAAAFNKFDAYQVAKYNRDGAWKLRDVAMIAHVKPRDSEHALLVAKLVNKEAFPDATKSSGFKVAEAVGAENFGKLAAPDTWEVNLSATKGDAEKKTEYWAGVVAKTASDGFVKGCLGYLALLRNLRNIVGAGVDVALVEKAILKRQGAKMVFPFRYVAAARAVPQLEPVIDQALIAAVDEAFKLPGTTVICVDNSGSMYCPMSAKSDLHRIDAAAALASVASGDRIRVIGFATQAQELPYRKGMAGIDVVKNGPSGGTDIGKADELANSLNPDRILGLTDERSHTRVPKPKAKHNYMINVASYQNGVGYGDGWVHIDGFSEAIFRYIAEAEGLGEKAEEPTED